MRKPVIAITTAALGLALASPAPASAVDDVNTSKLRSAVTVAGILKHERAFQSIANANGGTRASGTPGYDASSKYVADLLRQAGYSVMTQPFTYPFFREVTPAKLSLVTPQPKDLTTAVMSYSSSGDVTGKIVPIDLQIPPGASANSSTSGCEASDFPAAASEPSIALVQRGTCAFTIKAANATRAGYDAVIILNEGQAGRTDLLHGTLGSASPSSIPVVGVDYADGVALAEAAKQGGTAHVVTSTEVDPNRKTQNILATSPAGKQRGRVIVGSHLDSVPSGPGINDNGSGSAADLEIALQMARLGYTKRLQHRVTFAFWGAEESGLIGSTRYVASLTPAQKADIYANLNFDMIGSPNYVNFVYDGDGSSKGTAGPPGSDAIEKIFTDYFDAQGIPHAPTAFDGRSDYGPFIAEGIPAGGLFSGAEGIKTAEEAALFGGAAGIAYDKCYHQACDTITNLNTTALWQLGDAAAHVTQVLTMSQSGIFVDGSSARQSLRAKSAAPDSGQYSGHALQR